MSSKAPITPPPFTVIESGDPSRNREVELFGEHGAMHYQNLLFRIMDHLCDGAYAGGMWEMREFENGAVFWVFPGDRMVKVNTFNGYDVTCSIEAVSIAANIITLSSLLGKMAEANVRNDIMDKAINNFELQRDVGSLFPERADIYRIID